MTVEQFSFAPNSRIYVQQSSDFDSKGTTNSPNDQTNSEENPGILQGGGNVLFRIEGDGDIEDIDLNEAYELSEEEAAQLIVGLKFTSTFADIVDNKIAKIFKQNSRERAADP